VAVRIGCKFPLFLGYPLVSADFSIIAPQKTAEWCCVRFLTFCRKHEIPDHIIRNDQMSRSTATGRADEPADLETHPFISSGTRINIK
jgi:hypothetical protein